MRNGEAVSQRKPCRWNCRILPKGILYLDEPNLKLWAGSSSQRVQRIEFRRNLALQDIDWHFGIYWLVTERSDEKVCCRDGFAAI